MSLTDTAFAALADVTLGRLAESLEALDEEGALDVEILGGVLSIETRGGSEFIVSRHGPSRQIWLSSPLSGGLHFDYDSDAQAFALPDGRRLDTLLTAEVETLLSEEEA